MQMGKQKYTTTGWCKGKCNRKVYVSIRRTMTLHYGSLGRRVSCQGGEQSSGCGATWTANTRERGGKGAWDDMTDGSVTYDQSERVP